MATKVTIIKNTELVVGPTKGKVARPRYTCGPCQRSFSFTGYITHLRTVHRNRDKWPCGRCDQGFNTITKLRKHSREERGLDPLSCVECDFTAATKSILDNHTRTHTLEKPYQCQICRRGFRRKSAYALHKKLTAYWELLCPKPGYGCPEKRPERNGLVLGDRYDKSSSLGEDTNAPQDNRHYCVCEKSDHPGNTILCDHCNDPYQTARAGLQQIPLQEWVCENNDTLAKTQVNELMRELPCQAWGPAWEQISAVPPRLLEFCRSLAGPEQDHDQNPPPDDPTTVSIAQSFPPTPSTDENLDVGNEVVSAWNPMTLGFEWVGMLSQGLSGAARDSSLDWYKSADSLQDDRERDQGRNQLLDEAYLRAISVTPPFDMCKTPASYNEAIPLWNSMAPGDRYDWSEPMLDGCIPSALDHLYYESTNWPLQATAMQPSPESWIDGKRLDDLGSGTGQEQHRTDDEALICPTRADVHDKWNDSGATPAPPPCSTAFNHESSTYSNVNLVDTSGCSSDPLSQTTSSVLGCTSCVAQKSTSWRQSNRDGTQLCTTCDATRPQELLVKMTRKSPSVLRKCANCQKEKSCNWNLSKEFRFCNACYMYERAHGGAARPKKLYERKTRKRQNSPMKCTNCLKEKSTSWSLSKEFRLCGACYMYERSHGGAARPRKLYEQETRKRRMGPMKCTNCLEEKSNHWNLSKEFPLCATCSTYEKYHGGTARPKELCERSTGRRRSGPRICTNCLTDKSKRWRWSKDVRLCNSCCQYTERNNGAARPHERWKEAKKGSNCESIQEVLQYVVMSGTVRLRVVDGVFLTDA